MYTPGMQTPRGGPPPQGRPEMGPRAPSMQSVHSLLSQGYLPPGHGYIPKPIKPDKPYGPTFISIMNRPWQGPGKKYLQYALAAWCVCILFLCATGLYWGHRNVSRMIVLRTEWFGAIFTIIFICFWTLTFYFIYRAHVESNRWRSYVRFRADGLYRVMPYNDKYSPIDRTPLETGTYGKKALKEIPKPGRRKRPRKGPQSQGGSGFNTPGGMYEQRAAKPMPIVEEKEDQLGTPDYPPPPPIHAAPPQGAAYGGQRYVPRPPQQQQQQQGRPQDGAGNIPMDSVNNPRRYGGDYRFPIQGAHGGQDESAI